MTMKISTSLSGDWTACRFSIEPQLYGEDVKVYFPDKDSSKGSPLAEALFGLPGVRAVKLSPEAATVHREDDEDWPSFCRRAAEILRSHAASGKPAFAPGTKSNVLPPEALRAKVADFLEKEINPSLAGHGGGVELVDVQGSTLHLRLSGGCQGCAHSRRTLRQGIERALRDLIPEIDEVIDATDHSAGSSPYA
ncbi:MAG: NifU family protein [Elusimicrobiota bacterium]|jgi:Fe-S cluster biogenesis protein NfuA